MPWMIRPHKLRGEAARQVPWMIKQALVRRALLGLTWDQVARAAGRSLLTDDIHLSDTAVAPLVPLVADFLAGVRARGP